MTTRCAMHMLDTHSQSLAGPAAMHALTLTQDQSKFHARGSRSSRRSPQFVLP